MRRNDLQNHSTTDATDSQHPGTIRNVTLQHRWDKLMRISQISYANPNLVIPD